MARARMALLPLLLLASAAFCATSFLAPRGAASSLRGSAAGSSQQPLEAAMQARGGQRVVADPNIYILGITALMIISIVANSRGFFNPSDGFA